MDNMTLRDFITELFLFYSPSGTEREKTAKFETYVNIIGEKVSQKFSSYDYSKLLKHLQIKYGTFPSIEKIMDALPIGRVVNVSYSGQEGKVINRTLNGVNYEFTVVPNHWDGIKTNRELDNDIYKRKFKEN